MTASIMESLPSMEDVQQAVALLQSVGVQNLCSQGNASFDPVLPLCAEESSHELYQLENYNFNSNYNLRGSAATTTATASTLSRMLSEPRHNFDSLEEKEMYYIYNICGALFCVACVALIAGLFLGLLTLDVLQLRIIERASIDDAEKLYARTVLPIVEERHLLLVTLLLLNALAYETLPIFLDALVPSWAAILLSTTLVMWFGEILPSGIFTGPHQLYLGYKLAPLTKCFLWIMYPFAKPLALCLDYLVKTDDETSDLYHRGELSALVRIQYEDMNKVNGGARAAAHIHRQKSQWQKQQQQKHRRDDSWHATKQEIIEKAVERQDDSFMNDQEHDPVEQLAPPLDPTEVDLIEGALQMKTVLVMDVYTPLSMMYAVADDLVLDRKGFTDIYQQGYSRVPVYRRTDVEDDKTHILGFLMVRQLMLIDWDHKRDVSTLPLQRPRCISPRMNLVDALRILRSKGYLMAFVCARPDLANKALDAEKPLPVEAGFMGIVTLEDIMESLLQERIYDEWDIKDRDRAVATLQRWAAEKLQDFYRKKAREKKRRTSLGEHSVTSAASESAPLLPSVHQDQNGGNNYRSVY